MSAQVLLPEGRPRRKREECRRREHDVARSGAGRGKRRTGQGKVTTGARPRHVAPIVPPQDRNYPARRFANLNFMVVSYSSPLVREKSATGPGGGLKNSTGPSIMSPAKTRVQPSNAIPLIAMRPGLGLKTTIQLLTVMLKCSRQFGARSRRRRSRARSSISTRSPRCP